MHDEGIIDAEEYRIMRRKVLGITEEDFSNVKTAGTFSFSAKAFS